MLRGNSGWAERSAEPYLPYLGHVAPGAVLLNDGSLLAMGRLRGMPHELASAAERNAAARFLNGLWRNIADDTITIGTHLVRHRQVERLPAAVFRNAFSARLDHAYRSRVLQDRLYQNDWYLSVIVAPRTPGAGQAAGRQLNKALARFRKQSRPGRSRKPRRDRGFVDGAGAQPRRLRSRSGSGCAKRAAFSSARLPRRCG